MLAPLVVKVGGAIFENEQELDNLCRSIAEVNERPLLLVHGGGIIVETLLKQLGIKSQKIDALRVTPFDQVDLITGALAGTANKKLTAAVIKNGRSAVGLCLGDGRLCYVSQISEVLGAVALCRPGNPAILQQLLGNGYLPVISSIGIGNDGQLYNINADQAAVTIGKLIKGLVLFLSDVPGVLDENGELIPQITLQSANEMIARGIINHGMAIKVNAALEASADLGKPVALAGWKNTSVLSAALRGQLVGTQVVAW